MLDYLHELIGSAPLGFEFLEYIFSFVLVLCGLFAVFKIVEVVVGLFR